MYSLFIHSNEHFSLLPCIHRIVAVGPWYIVCNMQLSSQRLLILISMHRLYAYCPFSGSRNFSQVWPRSSLVSEDGTWFARYPYGIHCFVDMYAYSMYHSEVDLPVAVWWQRPELAADFKFQIASSFPAASSQSYTVQYYLYSTTHYYY